MCFALKNGRVTWSRTRNLSFMGAMRYHYTTTLVVDNRPRVRIPTTRAAGGVGAHSHLRHRRAAAAVLVTLVSECSAT